MTEITIEILDSLNRILPVIKKPLLLRVVRNIAKTKIEENKKQLKEAFNHIRSFEKQHKMVFEDLKKNIPADGDPKVHEDLIEWSFWVHVKNKLDEEIKQFKKLNRDCE